MDQLTRFRIPGAIAVGALVLVAVVYVALISPQAKKLSSLDAQKTELNAQLTGLQTQISTLRREKAQFVPNCEALGKELTEIPSTTDASTFLQQVTNLAKESGDPNTPSFSLPQAGTSKNAVTAIQFTMTLAGNYGQMTSFIQGLNSLPRLFTVASISITGGPVVTGAGQVPASGSGSYSLSLTGNIYYAASQQNVCGSIA